MYVAFGNLYDLFQNYGATNFPAERKWGALDEVHFCLWYRVDISCNAVMRAGVNIKQDMKLE